MELKPRESIILVDDFEATINWYCDVLGFNELKRYEESYHYSSLENNAGIKLSIGLASEMQVELTDRSKNSIALQFEVEDVKTFLAYVEEHGGKTTAPPIFSEEDGFWFASFADLEGNSHWVVDANCP